MTPHVIPPHLPLRSWILGLTSSSLHPVSLFLSGNSLAQDINLVRCAALWLMKHLDKCEGKSGCPNGTNGGNSFWTALSSSLSRIKIPTIALTMWCPAKWLPRVHVNPRINHNERNKVLFISSFCLLACFCSGSCWPGAPIPACISGGEHDNRLNYLPVKVNTDRQTFRVTPVGQLDTLIHLMCVVGMKQRKPVWMQITCRLHTESLKLIYWLILLLPKNHQATVTLIINC